MLVRLLITRLGYYNLQQISESGNVNKEGSRCETSEALRLFGSPTKPALSGQIVWDSEQPSIFFPFTTHQGLPFPTSSIYSFLCD